MLQSLAHTLVSAKGYQELKSAQPQMRDCVGPRFVGAYPPEGIGAMRLALQSLAHALVSAKGYQELKSAQPRCEIVWDRDSSLPTRRRASEQ